MAPREKNTAALDAALRAAHETFRILIGEDNLDVGPATLLERANVWLLAQRRAPVTQHYINEALDQLVKDGHVVKHARSRGTTYRYDHTDAAAAIAQAEHRIERREKQKAWLAQELDTAKPDTHDPRRITITVEAAVGLLEALGSTMPEEDEEES